MENSGIQSFLLQYLPQFFLLGYTVVSMVLGGLIADKKGDFATRGAAVSLFSGIFGILFMYFGPPSEAYEGDKTIWPKRAPEATILNLMFLGVSFLVYSVIAT
jgi:hypothetical protein